MDPIRQLRLLIPPFFLYVSLAFRLYQEANPLQKLEQILKVQDGQSLSPTALVATLLGAAVPLGFLIGALTYSFAWAVYRLCRRCIISQRIDEWIGLDYEVALSWKDFDALCAKLPFALRGLVVALKADDRQQQLPHVLPIVVAFDHSHLRNHHQGLHDWLARQWTAFIVSMNSCVALGLAHALARYSGIEQHWSWTLATLSLVVFLLINAGRTRWMNRRAFRALLDTLHSPAIPP